MGLGWGELKKGKLVVKQTVPFHSSEQRRTHCIGVPERRAKKFGHGREINARRLQKPQTQQNSRDIPGPIASQSQCSQVKHECVLPRLQARLAGYPCLRERGWPQGVGQADGPAGRGKKAAGKHSSFCSLSCYER